MTLSTSGGPTFGAVTCGSVTGRDHRRAERDGQDGFAIVTAPGVISGVVTDGCSSSPASEVGARLGARWLARSIARRFAEPGSAPAAARAVTDDLIGHLDGLARSLDPAGRIEAATVADGLLFGFLAAVLTPTTTIIFGVGDGLVWIDGATTCIDPGEHNAPLYPAYALLGAVVEPTMHHVAPARPEEHIAVGTDGAAVLLSPSPDDLDTLLRDPRLLRNPSLLRKRLVALGARGRFWDDATIASLRRTG